MTNHVADDLPVHWDREDTHNLKRLATLTGAAVALLAAVLAVQIVGLTLAGKANDTLDQRITQIQTDVHDIADDKPTAQPTPDQ